MIRHLIFSVALTASAVATPLSIDLTTKVPPAVETPIGPGTTKNPQGHTITADSRSLFFDGKPWIPIAGEFHYSRYPHEEWRDELLKMKAGGITVVSTYVFWIHQEEERGKMDWAGDRSLRDFLKLCQEIGLKVIVRMGPWDHGEVRNGGFPDWVQNSGTKLRTKDPAFLQLVEPLFKEEAKQMEGLLWKDGGPVIGVQMDNECPRGDYLLALKEMAIAAGVDVPLYTITGWQGGVSRAGLLPTFGGYIDGFWGGRPENYRKEFFFSDVRAMNDLGAQLTTRNVQNSQLLEQFPYACAEIGPGMMSSYRKRIKINPEDAAALALGKLGSGNNMPGYYMYQGGMNPDGKLTTLEEDHPNQMPIKDYDFQTALGACGQVREQFQLLREQHLFLEDFGAQLARMSVFLPEQRPRDLNDFDTLRWSMRADEKGSGFVFFSNQQPAVPMPEKKDVQFEVKTSDGSLVVPTKPIDIPTGAYGLWPIRLDCDGVMLNYATVQPLCHLATAEGTSVYFFSAIEGVRPELAVNDKEPQVVTPGTAVALTATNPKGKEVSFVVLTPEQGRQFYRAPFAGQPRAILSKATVFADGSTLRFQSDSATNPSLSIFPSMPMVQVADGKVIGTKDNLFTHFDFPIAKSDPVTVTATLETPAGPAATTLKGDQEATWADAAVYKVTIPDSAADRRLVLDFHYVGDAARLYVGEKLYDDNFYNGDPMSIALWRIPREDWPKLRLKVLPYSEALASRLPESAKLKVAEARAADALDKIAVAATEQLEVKVTAD